MSHKVDTNDPEMVEQGLGDECSHITSGEMGTMTGANLRRQYVDPPHPGWPLVKNRSSNRTEQKEA